MRRGTHLRVFATVAIIAVWSTSVSGAEYVSSDVRLPSPTYHSTQPVIYPAPGGPIQVDSFFDVFLDLVRVQPPPLGPAEIHSFFDVFTELNLQPLGAPATVRESPTRQTISMVRLNGLPPGEPVIATEMLQLDISGGTLPPGVMIRESPTLQSTGQTRYLDNGGGTFRIDSFFDVFTELSIDGGQSWIPATSPMHLEGALPEPGAVTMLLVGGSALALRRRRALNAE